MKPEAAAGLLKEARAALEAKGFETAALDARLLLQAAAGLNHAELVAEPQRVVGEEAVVRLRAMLARRLEAEPVSRILGKREFYGRPFRVTEAVLDPRPDTETLIEAALPLMGEGSRVLDLGTGSGIIAITLLAECLGASGVAVDVSPGALAVARCNAEDLGVAGRLALLRSDWFEAVEGRFDLIVSNPPYIPRGEIAGLVPEVKGFDPHLALDGGGDGLDPYRRIAAGAGAHLEDGGHVLVEIGVGQEADIAAIFAGAGFREAARHRDLGGRVRVLRFV
ncbi:peptide chain release factor N(5)-glutamine methyltransferase [Aestuariivirga sp.]|uniref:peptide chain release factor N(5)-glutamine methyltransferase n=1 Tax=Aestuariivirga sp. TaxID=2650926 RepID=UPI0039E5439F